MRKSIILTFATPFLAGSVFAAPGWNASTYGTGGTLINNYADADAVIGGTNLLSSHPANYNTSNTQDNNDGGGPFGLGVQLVGLPAGDNNDFAFQATGNFTVGTTGNYTFFNNTDDGSRLRLRINGGASSQIITDDVLSGPHTVGSAPVALNAGDSISLEWMWFERGGGAEGESFYALNGGANALWQDPSQGLTLVGGQFPGTVYRANTGGQPAPNNLAAADNLVTNGVLRGSGVVTTINMGGPGGRAGAEGPIPGGGGDNFTLSATGYITLAAGDYTFFTNTDDGARLRVNGIDVVVDDFLQGPTDSAYGVITLAAGTHLLEYTGFELGGGESFELWMAAGNFAAPKGAGAFGAQFFLVGDGPFAVDTVPEPTAGLLAGIGALVLVRRRRR